MIGFAIVGIAALVVFLQFKMAPSTMKSLFIKRDFDMKLVEPDEAIRLTYSLSNSGRLPIMFLNLFECLPEDAKVKEDEKFIKTYVKRNYAGLTINHRIYLLPKRRFTAKVHFSLNKRGVYKIGKCYLETGDLLGFKSLVETKTNPQEIVVMPKCSESKQDIKALGGFIGEISVKRFIMEDPVLTVGFRDYTGREPFKDISWMQYAKTGKLQVKQYDYTVDTNVAVVLNMDGKNPEVLEDCLELTRMACEELESRHIPYEFISNGDTLNLSEGLGRSHLNSIMYRLGKSRFINFYTFEDLMDRCIAQKKNNRSYIVVTPELADKDMDHLKRLQAVSDHEICILKGTRRDEHE